MIGRAIGLALLGLLLIAIMIELGRWQFGVYDEHQHADALARLHEPAVPLGRLLGPDQAFPAAGVGRPVIVRGRYLSTQQVYVRAMRGSPSTYAVATPLLMSNGSAVIVVRGSSAVPHAVAASGEVTVNGVLEPADSAAAPPGPRRIMSRLSIAGLVGAVRPNLYSGYVILRSSTPAQPAGLEPVAPPLPQASRWSGLRNLVYAVQWWVFAAFVAFMWWRITRDVASRPESGTPSQAGRETGSDSLSPLG
jgi:cytochrome oxidase assembly protein ShyY1